MRYLFLIAILLSYGYTSGQKGFLRIFNSYLNEDAYGITEDSTGFIVVGGVEENSTGYGYDQFMMKIDHAGEILWRKKIMFPFENGQFRTSDKSSCFIKLKDNNYAAIGMATYGLTVINTSCAKFDKNGDTMWTYHNNEIYDHHPTHIAEDKNGDILLLSYGISDKVNRIASYFYKLDGKSGKPLWMKYYLGMDTFFTKVAIDSIGNYRLFGQSETPPYDMVTGIVDCKTGKLLSVNRSFEGASGAGVQIKQYSDGKGKLSLFGEKGKFQGKFVVLGFDKNLKIVDTTILPKYVAHKFILGDHGTFTETYWDKFVWQSYNDDSTFDIVNPVAETELVTLQESIYGGVYGLGNIIQYQNDDLFNFFVFHTPKEKGPNPQIAEKKHGKLLIIPNLTTNRNFITIHDLGLFKSDKKLSIYSSSGQQVQSFKIDPMDVIFSSLKLSVEGLSEGLYTCVIQDDEGLQYGKFIVHY